MIGIIIFNILAALLILFIIAWFWVIKSKSTRIQSQAITIEVKDTIYQPSRIETDQSDIRLNFIRRDATPCSEYVLFDALEIHEQLPLNKIHTISLHNLKPGTYRFHCQMGMYQGELIVR
jgi:plastocyanin domain-containing protein